VISRAHTPWRSIDSGANVRALGACSCATASKGTRPGDRELGAAVVTPQSIEGRGHFLHAGVHLEVSGRLEKQMPARISSILAGFF
jgi:hypothetical protein